MGKPKTLKTLFFVNGVAPTAEQQLEADAMPGQVCFRNATQIHDDEAFEDFNRVAGEVPPRYAKEAERKAAMGEDFVQPPLAATTAPAAPQNAKASPAGTEGAGSGWKGN